MQMEGLPFTGYKGKITTPSYKDVQVEFNRLDELVKPDFQIQLSDKQPGNKPVNFGSEKALDDFTRSSWTEKQAWKISDDNTCRFKDFIQPG